MADYIFHCGGYVGSKSESSPSAILTADDENPPIARDAGEGRGDPRTTRRMNRLTSVSLVTQKGSSYVIRSIFGRLVTRSLLGKATLLVSHKLLYFLNMIRH